MKEPTELEQAIAKTQKYLKQRLSVVNRTKLADATGLSTYRIKNALNDKLPNVSDLDALQNFVHGLGEPM